MKLIFYNRRLLSQRNKKNGEKSQNSMKDIIYINQIYDRLEQKRVKFNNMSKNEM